MKTLLLIDALALAYRAFHAIPVLSNQAGQPTNAVFGFIRMQRQLELKWKPTHHAVVFDAGLPAARKAALPEYKAQRPPMPDALASQLPLIEEYLKASSITSMRMMGEEADDVMATLATQAAGADAKVYLATHDKDLFALVNDHVQIVSPVKAGEMMGSPQVEAKTGVPPSKIREWLALTGDDADNIPGVPGVGAKTAAKLLGEFGGLDQLWTRLQDVKSPRLREELEKHRGVVENNLLVVGLRTDLGLDWAWDGLSTRRPDLNALLSLFERLEFHSLANETRDAASRLF